MESGIGGLIQGPGTVTSDSIPGGIMQNGKKVEEILVSNGEVIFSGKDLENLDPDGNIERAGQRLGNAPNGTRGAEAARMYAEVQSKHRRVRLWQKQQQQRLRTYPNIRKNIYKKFCNGHRLWVNKPTRFHLIRSQVVHLYNSKPQI